MLFFLVVLWVEFLSVFLWPALWELMPEFGTFGPFIRALKADNAFKRKPSFFANRLWRQYVGGRKSVWAIHHWSRYRHIARSDKKEFGLGRSLSKHMYVPYQCHVRKSDHFEIQKRKKKLTMTKSLFLAMLIFLLSAKFSNWNKFRGGGQKTTPPPTLSCASQIGNVRQKTLFQTLTQPVFRFKLYSSPFSSDIRKGKGSKKNIVIKGPSL